MNKLVLATMILLSLESYAAEISPFDEIRQAVNRGKQITFVIDFKQCQSDIPLGLATVKLTPNAIAIVGNNAITASDRHFTMDNPRAPGIPLFDYTKFNITEDGSVSVNVTTVYAKTYEKLANYTIHCGVGEGFKVFD